MKRLKCAIKLVPVVVNWERIFDQKYLSVDIKTGIFKPGTSLASVIRKIFTMPYQKLGKVFVKHCEPIDLDTFVEDFLSRNEFSEGLKDLKCFEAVSLKLTRKLYQV